MGNRQYVRYGGAWVDIGNPTSATQAFKYVASVGDGSATSYTLTHGLGAVWVTVQVYDNTSGKYFIPDHTVNLSAGTPTGTVTVTFPSAPSANQYRVVITG